MDEFNYDFELQYEEDKDKYYGFALVNMKVLIGLPLRLKLFMNPTILIADTGSTDNTTGSILSPFNSKKYFGPPTQTVTNQDMAIKSDFDFKTTITDHYGFEKEAALFKNFKYIPTAQYTLIAFNKYMLTGRKLKGDSNMGLCLSKGSKSVTFDLLIYTSQGVLFIMHAKRCNPKTESTKHAIT